MDSEWHRKNDKPHGVDFRYIYRDRRNWWFCPTYVPTLDEFMAVFDMLGGTSRAPGSRRCSKCNRTTRRAST
jgi:hypothetical protein